MPKIEKMIETGLLVLSSRTIPRMRSLLAIAANTVRSKLYVRIENGNLATILPNVYMTSSTECPNLDVRVLLGQKIPNHDKVIGEDKPGDFVLPTPPYKRVVLGGTFDRLHNGHKVLLSKAILLASKSITCGVTDVEMIQKKSLWELISPVDKRMEDVREFVSDVSDSVRCNTYPIQNPFGPSITEHDLECIVVSEETRKGGEAVNRKREEKGMTTLDVVVIDLLEADDVVLKETKISSSTRRRENLGTLIKPPIKEITSGPYIIGLTGGIASGKSNIAKYLKEQPDFEVIDCDKLGHTVYAPGSALSVEIGNHFEGAMVNGVVDRKILGAIVFKNKERLTELNHLVWPEIMRMVQEAIQKTEKKFVVIEAAVLLEANWTNFMNELWTVFVPPEEAIKRMLERDGITEQQARSRLTAQVDNKTRVDASNVVFCSLWTFEETKRQVERALEQLRRRVQ